MFLKIGSFFLLPSKYRYAKPGYRANLTIIQTPINPNVSFIISKIKYRIHIVFKFQFYNSFPNIHYGNPYKPKKNRLETLSLPVLEGVEALYNKVKQRSSPLLEHFAKPFLLYLEISTFQGQKSVREMRYVNIYLIL